MLPNLTPKQTCDNQFRDERLNGNKEERGNKGNQFNLQK